MSTVGTLTTAGLALIVGAQVNNTPVTIDGAQISSVSNNVTGDETALSSVVYTAPRSALTLSKPGPSTLRASLYLGPGVGTFTIGTIGLLSGQTLVALAVFPGAGSKIAAAPPITPGNTRTFIIDVPYQGSDAFNYAPGPINAAQLVANLVAGGSSTITTRQLRTIMANGLPSAGLPANSNAPLNTALAPLGVDNITKIQSLCGTFVTLGDGLSELARTTMNLSTAQWSAVFVAASTLAP